MSPLRMAKERTLRKKTTFKGVEEDITAGI